MCALLTSVHPNTARADDPKPPAPAPVVAPVAANAVITKLGTPPLVFLADKADSKLPVKWRVKEPADAQFKVFDRALVIINPVPGVKYKVTLTTYGDEPTTDSDVEEVVFSACIPPPAPAPTPAPAPAPVVPPAPAPDAGTVGNMRVLILFESTANMTRAQTAAIYSPEVNKYLWSKCIKDTAGQAEWRRWDKDVDASGSPAEWQAALAAAKADPAALPKVAVFSGTTLVGTSPIADEASLLAYLKSKGGN